MARFCVSCAVVDFRVREYARYILVLAPVILLSCQPAAHGPEASPAAGQSSQQPSEVEIPANTTLWVQLQKALDSSKLKSGDQFSGEIAEAVLIGGKPVIPKGASVQGRVGDSQSAQGQGSAGQLSLQLESFTVSGKTYNVKTAPVTLQAAPLQANPGNTPDAKDVKNAFVPKNGVLQFFLSEPVRIRA